MLYFIGGGPRAGKTTLAEALGKRLGIVGAVGTDMLRDAVGKEVLNSENPNPNERTDFFFPRLQAAARAAHRSWETFIFEGDYFLPRHVAELGKTYPVRAVFLGLSEPDLDTMIKFGGRHNWLPEYPPETYPGTLRNIRNRCALDKAGCEEHGFDFFDVSKNFTLTHRRALGSLTMPERGQDLAAAYLTQPFSHSLG